MSSTETYETPEEVARVATVDAVETLKKAIDAHGSAVWVLAGGTSPNLAYKELAYNEIKSKYVEALDWSKVTILIGDERMVPLTDPASNWQGSVAFFDSNPLLAKVKRIVPQPELGEVEAALAYEKAIKDLDEKFDLVWVGIGEDGHTMSLFPGNPAFLNATESLIIPVYDSPKEPPIRITLTLKAMELAEKLVVFAVGETKRAALMRAKIDPELPIAKVAATVEKSGGEVVWLYDRAAAGYKDF